MTFDYIFNTHSQQNIPIDVSIVFSKSTEIHLLCNAKCWHLIKSPIKGL